MINISYYLNIGIISDYYLQPFLYFEVCDDVTELVCDLVPYTKCELEWINETITGYEDMTVSYIPWVCEEIDTTIQHTKMEPKCKNETKLNCVTLWTEDENGESVIFLIF